jgi:hypothetical protein
MSKKISEEPLTYEMALEQTRNIVGGGDLTYVENGESKDDRRAAVDDSKQTHQQHC